MNSNSASTTLNGYGASLEKLLEACLLQRVSADKWVQLTQTLLSQSSSRLALSDLLLNEPRLKNSLNDPLYPAYIARALTTELLTPFDVLTSLTEVLVNIQSAQDITLYPLLRIMCQAISHWKPSSTDIVQSVPLLWNIEQLLHRFINHPDFGQDHVLFIEALDAWNKLLTCQPLRPIFKVEKGNNSDSWKKFENDIQDLRGAAATKLPLGKAQELETILGDFLLNVTPTEEGNSTAVEEIPNIPILGTRAALMIWLISLRECMSLGATDEFWATIDQLAEGSTGLEIFSALILAAFDALSVVVKRRDMTLSTYPDPLSELSLYQSILVNRVSSYNTTLMKIPALLATRREYYAILPEDLEYSILGMFTKMDPILMSLNVTSITNLETGETNDFPQKDFRQDFIYAMIKFGLLDADAPARMLTLQTEDISALMDVKDIVDEAGDIMDEEGAIERIVGRLGNLDGNQSILVSAILELVQMWTSSHNIHLLSVLCAALMKEPTFVDQFFLHTRIPSLVEPLREFLDKWTIDEEDDNGEHQLIYEQYNSILFLICFCVYRYGRNCALEEADGQGFVRTWLREFSKAKWLDMLSDEDSNAIGTWITALFDGEGISDELVRMSPPYKWLLISTTLFHQSVSAYRQGVLQLKTLKDGFEYFMQPFLEPCLLGAVQYLIAQIKVSGPDTIASYVEILSSLFEFLSPTQQEEDAFTTMSLEPKTSRVLHILAPSILSIISQLTVEQATPVKHLLDPIVEILRPYSNQFRLEISMGRKELIAAVRTTLSSLAQWSAGWTSGLDVPQGVDLRYLPVAIKSCGESVIIRTIVEDMWAGEGNYGSHVVVVAGMFLTVPFEIGFGKESLAEKFLLMVPGKTGRDATRLGLRRSLGPLTKLVERTIGWEGGSDGNGKTADEGGMMMD